MPTTTRNGVTVPVGSDPYNVTQFFKTSFESAGIIIPINNIADRDQLGSRWDDGKVPLNTQISRLDMPGVTEIWDGNRWVKSGGLRRSEWTGSIGVLQNTDWGPGPLTLDSAQSVNSQGFSSPDRDLITLPGPGEYAIMGRFRFSANTTGATYVMLMNEAASIQYSSADIPLGYSTAHLVYPNFYTPVAVTIRFRVRTEMAGTPTMTSRIAISRNA